jgi:hypothetical protein
MWHVAMKDEQQGPLTLAQVIGYLRAGLLNADDFAWRPGFDDWKPVDQIEEFLEPPLRIDRFDQAETDEATTVVNDSERGSVWKRATTRLGLSAFVVALGMGAIAVSLIVRDDGVSSSAGPVDGFTRTDFTENFQRDCIQRQRSSAQGHNERVTDLQITKYCGCVAEKMADGITYKQSVGESKTGGFDNLKRVAENAGASCR